MGKKGKIGKQRKDSYYKLAKQKGFRSRAAFKLIQLNRKFQFLENSRVCIDLCAAPGGWLQVASEYMPVSSVIVGVDLVPIAPIRNVITFQSDITSKECSDTIQNQLTTWKADVVLHDGAPNVGKNWLHDAYSQNVLVVNALKIACTHLNKGGWFITKIFRSTDYNSLLWVFGKLFAKVHATKPQASRQESAEIFVVCQNFRRPDTIDPRFFDPSAIFADVSMFDENLKKRKADLLKPANKIKKTKAVGYDDTEVTKTISDVEFVATNNHMDYLAQCENISLANADILQHDATTDEIKECCKDLRVLGKKDLLRLLKWRRTLRKDLISRLMQDLKASNLDSQEQCGDGDDHLENLTIRSDDDDIDSVPELKLDDIEAQEQEEKKKELKRIKRKEEKRVKDYQERVNYGMINHGDVLIEEENDLFTLNSINNKSQLSKIDDADPEELVDDLQDPDDEAEKKANQKKRVTFSREADVQYFEIDGDYDEEEESHPADDEEVVKPDEEKIEAPRQVAQKKGNDPLCRLNSKSQPGGGLITDLLDVNQSKIAAASRFFDSETFMDIDLEKEFETDQVNSMTKNRSEELVGANVLDSEDSGDSDLESIESDHNPEADSDDDASMIDDDQTGSSEQVTKKKPIKLDPQGLALATMMVSSQKMRKNIVDEGWNRFSHADTHLAPKWFREDEEKHCRRNIPVTPELMKEYKQRLKEIDAKPIKKVMEAKARKKRRALRKMEKVKKKVDAITTNEDTTQREKINQIKSVYKNATKRKKQEVKLVVGRKGLPKKNPGKGKYKMVDSRLKKDLRAKQRRENKSGKSGKAKSRPGGGKKRKRQGNNSMHESRGAKKFKSKKGSKSRRK